MNFQNKMRILFFICLLTRLCFVGRYLDCYDSVDFALGLHDYDLSLLQPHFPGYPVYIFSSWLFSKLFHHEVWALVTPSVLFGSLTVYPLSLLAREMFSEKVAMLATVLYIINPLCWLQAERPTSDTMALFFVMLSAYFLYCAFSPIFSHKWREVEKPTFMTPSVLNKRGWFNNRNCIFLGSLFLGFGLGVRLSYFPFTALWMGILFYPAIHRIPFKVHAILYGLFGFIIGIYLWLLPQISYVGWHSFLQNGLSFLHGHFTDWGGSVITFSGLERITCLAKSLGAYGLGGWWYDSSFFRLIPSLIIIISLFYSLKQYHFDHRVCFFGMYIIPYTLWAALGQNVANPRHILPIIPIILILIAYGLYKIYERGYKGIATLLTLIFVVSISITSFKLVIKYHNNIPAPIQLIQFIEKHFDKISTRIYCSNEKRVFDYYAPLWDVREVRNTAGLNIDLQSSLCKPQNILVVHPLGEIEKFGVAHPPIMMFEGNPYTDSTKECLLLYTLSGS